MREALFSQDGWGCQHVNQDTNWEVPSSPEPANKDPSGPPIWKPSVNNGTDLWESNLRNGGQPPTQQVPKPSWGHTPSSNLGGTWGEDDDGADSTNVWTGSNNSAATNATTVGGVSAPVGVGTSTGPPQWNQGVGVGLGSTNQNNSTGVLPVVNPGGGANVSSNIPTSGSVGGGNVSNAGNGWGDPREIRPLAGGGPMDIRNVDPMRSTQSGDPRDLRMIDPRDPIRGDPRGISGRLNGTSEMWGHHQQISHNQLPALNKMVSQVVGNAGTNIQGTGGIGPGGVGATPGNIGVQWSSNAQAVGQKDISKQLSGWEEPSPPPQRRNMPNYDDGTSLWGQQQNRVPSGGTHWKDMTDSMNRSHLIRTQNPSTSGSIVGNSNVSVGGNPNNPMVTAGIGPQARLSTIGGPNTIGVGVGGQHKQDGTMWVPNNNGRNPIVPGWGDESHNISGVGATVTGSNWIDDKSNAGSLAQQLSSGSNSWSDSPSSGWGGGNKPSKMSTSSSTAGWNSGGNVVGASENDLTSDWNSHGGGIVGKSQQQKLASSISVGVLNAEMIKQSKQFRILVENGFKKDDVERALLSANMNIEEAAEILRANSSLAMESGWRRHDETPLGSYADHSNSSSTSGFPGRYPTAGGAQSSMAFPPNTLLNSMSGNSSTGGSNNANIGALQVQKYLNQQATHNVSVGGPQSVSVNTNASVSFGQNATSANQPAINLASNTNNQPSGQQIRMLGQQIQLAIHSGFISSQILTQPLTQTTLNLLNQLLSNIKHLQAAQQSLSRGNNANPMAVNVAISKYKQQIQNLQNQINAQQAIYIKQQTSQQHPAAHLNNTSSEYLRNHDAINALQSNFSELNLNKPNSAYQGTTNQQSRLNQWKLPVLEKDNIVSDSTEFSRAPGATKHGTWSTGRNIGDGWPDPSSDNENKDWSVSQPSSSATTYTDLVQEFEPGKPWKIKSIEDDPSITPGSVARSPLSINSTPKDADIFANTGKNSPTDLPPLSLSSSTWSFNPNQNFPSWSESTQQCATSELWTNSLNKTSRGPPPGLGTNKAASGVTATTTSTVTGNANGWLSNRGGVSSTNTTWSGGNVSWSSSWLLLKNLTAQIDGPTLRTLCMQHGPLANFHLYLNQGIALCKYATREEANKAQMALNNCVLGNTTIFAESPSENEVQNILQHLPQTPSSANSVITPSGGGNVSTGVINVANNTNNSGAVGGGSTSGSNNGAGAGNTGSNNSVGPGSSSGSSSVSATSHINPSNTNVNVNGSTSTSSKNTTNTPTGSQPSVSVATTVGNSSSWRQATQNQAIQSQQNRPTGRESDYDYISQFVCSIVDD